MNVSTSYSDPIWRWSTTPRPSTFASSTVKLDRPCTATTYATWPKLLYPCPGPNTTRLPTRGVIPSGRPAACAVAAHCHAFPLQYTLRNDATYQVHCPHG